MSLALVRKEVREHGPVLAATVAIGAFALYTMLEAAERSGGRFVGLARFLLYSSGSALAWAGAWVGVGFLLAGSIAESPDWLGIPATVWVAIAVTAVTMGGVAITGWRRRHQRVDETEAAAARLMGLAA